MNSSTVDIERYEGGRLGDLRLQKRAWCRRTLVASPGSCILTLSGGQRRGEVGFGQILSKPSVTVAELILNKYGSRKAGLPPTKKPKPLKAKSVSVKQSQSGLFD